MGLLTAFISCQKDQYDYKKFLNGEEIVYAGLARNFVARGGNFRAALEWEKSIDNSVANYVVYWNNNSDSAVVPASSADANGHFQYIVPNLPEYVQSFKIVAVTANGSRSIGQMIGGIKVYGNYYTSTLTNRKINSTAYNFSTGVLTLKFFATDTSNITTVVNYPSTSDTVAIAQLKFEKDSLSLRIPDFADKIIGKIYYRSSYKPATLALDTFWVNNFDSLFVGKYASDLYKANGTRININAAGVTLDTVVYSNVSKQTILSSGVNFGKYVTDDIANAANNANTQMFLTFNEDLTIDISGYVGGTGVITNHPSGEKSTYNLTTGELSLKYKYTLADGNSRIISEILKF